MPNRANLQLSTTTNPTVGGITRAQFLRGVAAAGALAAGAGLVGNVLTSAPAAAATPSRRGLTYRGVTYDTGCSDGLDTAPVTRMVWNRALVRGEIRAIKEDLHANAVTVLGSDIGRLAETAAEALERGLQVSIQPRLFDHPQADALAHLARAAKEAERLRRRYDPEVILIVGCEFMLFTPGIVPGANFFERVAYLTEGNYDMAELQRLLNEYVAKAVDVARRHFHGRITYGAASDLEEIDWSKFDIVGLDYYSYHRRRADHTKELAPFRRWNKPIMILEFGCATFRGAPEAGGMGWDIVDYEKNPPVVKKGYVRSERDQADHLANMIEVFEAEGFLGASPYTFISPDVPHSPTRKYDLDMAAFALCKVIRDDYWDETSPYRWEPKQSFHAVAAQYGRARRS